MNTSVPMTARTSADQDGVAGVGVPTAQTGWWPVLRARLRTAWSPRSVWLGPGQLGAGGALSGPATGQALMAWRSWCETNAGSCCELGLSGHWLWSTVATDPAGEGPGGKGAGDAQGQGLARARSQWAHYLGVDEALLDEAWLWRALPQAATPLVCAMPADLLDELRAVAAASHVCIDWLGPWWLRGAQAWLGSAPDQGRARLSLHEPGLVTQLEREPKGGEPARLWRIWTEPRADADTVSRGLQGSLHLSLPDLAQVMSQCGTPIPTLLEGDAVDAVLKGVHPAWRADA